MSHVLIVDDEESICWGLEQLLRDSGHDVSVASTAEQALQAAERRPPELIVLDVRLPGMDGLAAMEHFRHRVGPVPIVVITAFGSLDVAVTAMRNGAFDYLCKPFDLEQAAAVIDRALARPASSAQQSRASEDSAGDELLGSCPAMQEVFKRIALVAPTDASVLIVGESGTGKELVARAIHRHSHRAKQPFVPIHLASLSPALVESELFGCVRGALTGADVDRRGLLRLAHEATVFFDEAGDIPPAVQVKLLRVLEQQEVTPVGSTHAQRTTFRVIAGTNRPQHAGSDDVLRRDLYFRLAGFEISLPPLRERGDDIPLLAEAFLRRAHRDPQPHPGFTAAAIAELRRRRWPGNVRQLRHAVEHGKLLARGGRIGVEHLPLDVQPPEVAAPSAEAQHGELDRAVRAWAQEQLALGTSSGRMYQDFLARVEPSLFDAVLARTTGNRAAAADVLGIHRATLRKKLAGSADD